MHAAVVTCVTEIVVAVPNDGSSEILNTIGGTIALVFRGNVPLVEKARHVQAVRPRRSALGTFTDSFTGWS